jgi:hypothetical protein
MSDTRFKSFVAVLIACVTILGAAAACLASVALSSAGDADFEGMSATINAQREGVVNQINAYEHLRAYTAYTRYLELGYILWDEASQADSETAAELDKQRKEILGLASEMRSTFFQSRYMDTQQGFYNLQRELDEAWAEDVQNYDLEPIPHFDRADALRTRSSLLAADMITFAVSFWFLTLANVIENRWKYLMITLGILIGLGGILGILIAQVLL